ncbi:hypothetical protein WR25_21034 [Diploscapter pachys]|uniref:Uncharacterized protein n=1 Tax=Diploscapter pachys TaxID=2018661 RepID=A0A2A2LK51_9BILA|nr:hypothetical protein WR25_21034 [Diploscapter pachys]
MHNFFATAKKNCKTYDIIRKMTGKEVHRSEFTDLDETFRIEVFDDEDHGGLHMLSENGNLSKVQDDLITQVILGHLPQELDFYGRDSRQQQTVSLSLPLQLPVRTL